MDSCNGYIHHWSDDSYSQGNYPCPGPEQCSESKLPAKIAVTIVCSACEAPIDSPQHYYGCPEGEGYADPLRPPQPRLPAWDDPPKGRT